LAYEDDITDESGEEFDGLEDEEDEEGFDDDVGASPYMLSTATY
jgi:hypothetical protein